MEQSEVGSVLEDLRASTERLVPIENAERLDIAEIERALAERERVVSRLSELVTRCPDAFTRYDADRVRASLHAGRRALETLMRLRQFGFTEAGDLSRNQYVLKTIGTFSSRDE